MYSRMIRPAMHIVGCQEASALGGNTPAPNVFRRKHPLLFCCI